MNAIFSIVYIVLISILLSFIIANEKNCIVVAAAPAATENNFLTDVVDDSILQEEDAFFETFFDEVVIPSMDKLEMDLHGPSTMVEVSELTAAALESSCSADDSLAVRILEEADRKLVIIGGGPAGMTAAIYAARADMHPLVISKDGGQLESTSIIDNFPGFEDGVDAIDMLHKLEKQAKRFGTDFLQDCNVQHVDLNCRPFKIYCENNNNNNNKNEIKPITSSAIIIATGASHKWIGVDGEQEYLSKGVHTCATCDGFFYKDKHAVVIGGGDTAMEQALFLARLCSKVTVIHRGTSFRASRSMASRVLLHSNITIKYNTVVTKFVGGGGKDGHLTHLVLQSNTDDNGNNNKSDDDDGEDKEEMLMAVDGVFVAIGQMPNTQLFHPVKKNDDGYIYTIPGTTMTSIKGVFAAGDVQDSVYRQAITSAGTGAMAAMDAERWLCEHGC